MAELNKIFLIGHLTKDPETVQFSNSSVTNIRVASNRTYRDSKGDKQNDVTFVDAKAFGKMGDTVAKFFKKGSPILIEGRLSLDEWQDKQTNAKRSRLYIIMENFQFMPVGNGNGNGNNVEAEETTEPTPEPNPYEKDGVTGGDFDSVANFEF